MCVALLVLVRARMIGGCDAASCSVFYAQSSRLEGHRLDAAAAAAAAARACVLDTRINDERWLYIYYATVIRECVCV